jgi:hypothetical protein
VPAGQVERSIEGLAEIASAASFQDLKAEVKHRGRRAPLTLARAEISAAAGGQAGAAAGSALLSALDDAKPPGRPTLRRSGIGRSCLRRRRT